MLALGLALIPAAWSASHALAEGWVPTGDDALIALRVGDVFTTSTPLTGQPSTSDLYGGSKASHPGPMAFWAMAVPYALLGPAVGLVIGATLVNALAIAGVWFVAFRREGAVFAFWSLLLVTVMTWGLGANFLHDPISSNAATYMVVLLFFLVWSMAVGDLALLPLTAAVVSFVFQTHLSVLGQNAGFVLLGAVALAWELARRWRRGGRWWRDSGTELRRWGLVSLIVVAVLWSPVVVQQFTGSEGNLTEIWRSYSYNKGHAHGASWALDRLSTALGPVPVFARTFGQNDLAYLNAPTGALRWFFLVPLAALAALALANLRRGSRRAFLLALAAFAAVLSGVYSALSLPERGQPELKQSAVRWMWMSSLVVWLAIGWLAWRLVPATRRRRFGAATGLVLLAGLLVASGVASDSAFRQERDQDRFGPIGRALPHVREALRPGDYVVQFGGVESGLTVGPAVALDIQAHGHDIYTQKFFERAFGSDRTYADHPDVKVVGTVTVIDQADARPGARLVAIIPHLSPSVRRQLGEKLARVESALDRSGGLELTDSGQRLRATDGRSGNEGDRQLAVALRDLDSLLATGQIARAVDQGYVRPFGVGQQDLDALAQAVNDGKVVSFEGVFVGPPPS